MPSTSVENYLKAIYLLQREGERVKTKELAEHLTISLPSVTSMIKALSDDALVDYEPYRGVLLTEEGQRLALKVIRNHRLIEVFLVQTLDYTWDEVHDEAEALEHAMSDTLADRIDHFLNYPRFDPHGDPIPTANGEIERRPSVPLGQVEAGVRVRVLRVLDQTPEVLRYLDRVNIRLEQEAEVLEVLPFDGQMTIEVGGQRAVLSKALASKVLVHRIDA